MNQYDTEANNFMADRETAKLILERRRGASQYQSYLAKKLYYDAVANGDTNAVNDLSQQNYRYPSEIYEQSDSYSDAMFQLYYDAICGAAEMCLIAIQNGLPDMVAYDIRDNYVAEFDNAVSLPDLYDLIHGMAHEFAARVKYAKAGGDQSVNLRLMMSYIASHLTDSITLQDVADAADLSRNYASFVFRNELGMTMSEFIMRERIREAQRILSDRRYTISDIAERLHFCSQSYFTQCFSRMTGKTPGEYRTNVCFLK